jgi:hypothetical protein
MFVWTVGFDLSFGFRIRQHSQCKRTWPMPTFLKPSHCEVSFHLMQVLRSLLSSSTTWSWCKCYFELVSNALFWAIQGVCHLIHGEDYEEDYGVASLDVAIFIWCLALHLAICVLILLDSKVQGKFGFLYDILVYWIAAHWSDLFNSQLLILCLGLVSSSPPHFFNFKISLPFF